MRIGTIEFGEYPVFAAPMEDVSEPSFRYMCKKIRRRPPLFGIRRLRRNCAFHQPNYAENQKL